MTEWQLKNRAYLYGCPSSWQLYLHLQSSGNFLSLQTTAELVCYACLYISVFKKAMTAVDIGPKNKITVNTLPQMVKWFLICYPCTKKTCKTQCWCEKHFFPVDFPPHMRSSNCFMSCWPLQKTMSLGSEHPHRYEWITFHREYLFSRW